MDSRQAEGSTLAYQVWGLDSLPPIVFLHGFLGSGADFGPIAQGLSRSFYCVSLDLPGHGRSLRLPIESYSISGAAQGVIETLDRLGIDQTYLYGYSMGGRLGLYLAVHYPDRFPKVMLESASPGLPTASERHDRRMQDYALADRIEADFAAFLAAWYQQPLFTSLTQHDQFAAMLDRRRQNHPQEIATSLRQMGTGMQPSLWDHLPEIRNPLALVVGEFDPKFIAINQAMAKACPQATLQVIPQAGHNAHLENPIAIVQAIRDFFGTQG